MALPGMAEASAPGPEWIGATSAKFTDPITGNLVRRHVAESDAKLGAPESLCRNGFRKYFADSAGLVPVQGKLAVDHLENSLVHRWKSTRRTVAMPGADHHEKPEGIGQVPEPTRTIHAIRERRHVRQLESKEEFSDRPQGVAIVHRRNGLRALDQPAQEVDLSEEMVRKARPLDLWSRRNGIPCASQGEKSYRHPEYSTGFYAAGELVVGSSFARGHHGHRTRAKDEVGEEVRARQVLVFGFEEKTSAVKVVRELESMLKKLMGGGFDATVKTHTDPTKMHVIEFPSVLAKDKFWSKVHDTLTADEHALGDIFFRNNLTKQEKEKERVKQKAVSEVKELTRNWEKSALKECDEKYLEDVESVDSDAEEDTVDQRR